MSHNTFDPFSVRNNYSQPYTRSQSPKIVLTRNYLILYFLPLASMSLKSISSISSPSEMSIASSPSLFTADTFAPFSIKYLQIVTKRLPH